MSTAGLRFLPEASQFLKVFPRPADLLPGAVTTARETLHAMGRRGPAGCPPIRVLPSLCGVLDKPTWAFHSGGVGECTGCHSMHGTGNDTPYRCRSPVRTQVHLPEMPPTLREKRPVASLIATSDEDMPSGFPLLNSLREGTSAG